MALVDYGSDSGSDTEDNNAPSPLPPAIRPAAAPAAARLKPEATASGPAAPLTKAKPAPSSYAALAAVPLPPPKNRGIHKRAAKFTLEAASSIPKSATESTAASGHENPPPAKKPKLGSGSSSLLGMLPPPKQALPKAKPMPAPVRLKPLQVSADGRIENFGMAMGMEGIDHVEDEPVPIDFSLKVVKKAAAGDADDEGEKKETKIVKPLDLKGKGKMATIIPPLGTTGLSTKAVMPVMDFFGIGATPAVKPKVASTSASSVSISSAPSLPTFTPPEPTLSDAYPGYYHHPHTGTWEAYDPAYYQTFWQRWEDERKAAEAGKEGRGWEDLDSGRGEVGEFDVGTVLDPERKPVEPKKEIESLRATGGKGRNQLSSLIKNAQVNREALEDKIAQAKKNKRAAGMAYGF